MPQDLVVLQGGMSGLTVGADVAQSVTGTVAVSQSTTTAIASGTMTTSGSLTLRDKAKMQGYEGDPCGECQNYTLVRNGTCMKCNTCGGTSGCS
jgi:ribonucleoside-diphosphate reductase alpha chain